MKVIKLGAIIALVIPAGLVMAQSGDMKGMDMKSVPAEKNAKATSYKAVGVVKTIDRAKGTVTFAHEPVQDLNWPAMTMSFIVKDKMLFDKLAAEKKVAFEFVKQGPDYVVTTVK